LSNWTIAAGALVVLAVAAVVSLLILRHYGGKEGQVQLDAIRTAGTLVIGTGGAVALLLTARRQRYTELTLVHTSRDATERRITELYTKAAELLGSDQAPARLAGLYALERLAHSTVEHRQTIVDVICAYLRMPYAPPPQQRSYRSSGFTQRRRIRPLSDRLAYTTSTSRGPRHEQAQQELQVRLTAQNILFRNLGRDVWRRLRWWYPIHRYPAWRGIGLNLTGAFLLDFSLSDCQLDYADFTRAEFAGKANFGWAEFLDWASFEGARFTGEVDFQRAQFADRADFGSRYTDFEGARFTGRADFEGARFTHSVNFKFVQFGGGLPFRMPNSPAQAASGSPVGFCFYLGPGPIATSPRTGPISFPWDAGSTSGEARLISKAPGWTRPLRKTLCGRRAGRPDPASQTTGKTSTSYT
jgi:hypothetical protein